MKANFILLVLTISFCSCQKAYYQVCKTNTATGIVKPDKVVFEDTNCTVSYNLWTHKGNPGFSIYNKTETDIKIHLNKTFFVLNGIAFEYFQNRTFSSTSNHGTTVTSQSKNWNNGVSNVSNSYGYSTTFIEKQELTIPPKTTIIVSEFNILDTRYAHCDLKKFPSKKNIKTMTFGEENSPLVFYNLITYSTVKDTLRLETNFYVSEITNYPESEMYYESYDGPCGLQLEYPKSKIKVLPPDNFYFYYIKK